jgi:hypothetical protein
VTAAPRRRPVWLAALLAAALSVQAQEGGRGRRGGAPEGEDPDRTAAARGSLAGELGAQLAAVKKRLKLQPNQQAAWDTYVRRIEALMEDMFRGIPAPLPNESAPHQINRRVDIVRNRLAAMEDIADAAGQLYALLSPDQRELADELLPTTVPTLYSGLPDYPRGQPAQPARSGTRRRGP